jgi:hypothetical protein
MTALFGIQIIDVSMLTLMGDLLLPRAGYRVFVLAVAGAMARELGSRAAVAYNMLFVSTTSGAVARMPAAPFLMMRGVAQG